jgi:F420-dependent oxidoreductase-like protein
MPGGPAELRQHLRRIAQTADSAGFTSLWVMDHYFQIGLVGPPEMDMLEGYTTLAYLAACTDNVTLGTMVTGVSYRHPGLLVKIVSTLDVLSGGRAALGIGAAWNEREHLGLGVPFPPLGERFERLEEALKVVTQMWSEDNGSYEGRHYSLNETLNSPRAVSAPHPPIMIGGRGEKKTLRLAAQYAQIVNLTAFDPDDVAHLLDVLRGHCDALGTDYDAIEKQIMATRLRPDSEEFWPTMERLAGLGIDLVVFGVRPNDQVATTSRLAEAVLPRLAEL